MADATVEDLREAIALLKGRARTSAKASPEATAIGRLLAKSKVKGVSVDVRRDMVVLRVPLAAVAQMGRALSVWVRPAPVK